MIALLGAAALAAAPQDASAASARLLVVGRDGETLRSLERVQMRKRTVRTGKRRCVVAGDTALGVLAGSSLALRLRDYGSCGRRTGDAGGLYVRSIAGQRARGRSGWVYKLGRKAPTIGAADLAGRIRRSRRVLWFWCRTGSAGGCQRTLEVRPARTSARPGERLPVLVRGYDNNGRGVRVAGATVRLGSAKALTGSDGRAVITVPRGGGNLSASKAGLVRSFPARVVVR